MFSKFFNDFIHIKTDNSVQDAENMRRLRLKLGRSCFLLPILSFVFAFMGYKLGLNTKEGFYSISATFFTCASVWMISLLMATSKYFASYKGYTLADNILAWICSVASAFIVVFPCACPDWDDSRRLLPFIPMAVSNVIHCVSAGVLFGTFAVMIGFEFPKSSETKDIKNIFKVFKFCFKNTWSKNTVYNKKKIIRNKIYYICASIILLFTASQVVTSINEIKWMTIVNEAGMLWAFSFAWTVKGNGIKKLCD